MTNSFSEKKQPTFPVLRHTSSAYDKITIKVNPGRFNNSIVLVETKLFE